MKRTLAIAAALCLVLALVPGLAAAEEVRAGDTVVIGEGETVDGLTAFSGTVIVEGTVDGDLTAFAGDVHIAGTVTGDVNAFAGNVRITGTVDGDVNTASGNVFIGEGATVEGSLSGAAGNLRIEGSVAGNVDAGAGTIVLGDAAVIDGDLRYGGELQRADGAQVGGDVVEEPRFVAPMFPEWIGAVYAFFANLLLGAVLLLAMPRFSADVADRAITDPLRSGGVGLLALIAIPVALFVLLITIVGIPLAIAGMFAFGLLIWIATVYGRFVVGTWLLGLANTENRWLALLLGLLVVGIVAQIPGLGGLIVLLVTVLGLGALATVTRDRRRNRRTTPTETPPPSQEAALPGERAGTRDSGASDSSTIDSSAIHPGKSD